MTLSEGTAELWIMEGVNGLMIAADVKGNGHFTGYPSDKPSVALQIPFHGGEPPKPRIVRPGVCVSSATPTNTLYINEDQAVL